MLSGDTTFVPNNILESSDSFLTFSYGGGMKVERL
jgi:hypothetical protein